MFEGRVMIMIGFTREGEREGGDSVVGGRGEGFMGGG